MVSDVNEYTLTQTMLRSEHTTTHSQVGLVHQGKVGLAVSLQALLSKRQDTGSVLLRRWLSAGSVLVQ